MGFFDNKTVTLFNRSFNAETEEETYYPTLLEGVDLVETKGANVFKSGMDSADAAKLFVCIADVGKTIKPYLPPKEWKALPEEEKPNYITFTPAEDFFIKGDHTDAALPENDVYQWLLDNCDDCYRVTTIDKYEDILPHFEVGGV